jgi:hypothetical protein
VQLGEKQGGFFNPPKPVPLSTDMPDNLARQLFEEIFVGTNTTYFNTAALLEHHRLPGLVVINHIDDQGHERDFELPASEPFRVPFEPIELNESNADLLALCNESFPSRETARLKMPVLLRHLRGFPVLIALAVFGLLGWCLLSTAIQLNSRVAVAGIMFLTAFVVLCEIPHLGNVWFIIPGGVLLRRRFWPAWRPWAELYDSHNCVLLLRAHHGGWRATLQGEIRECNKLLTNLECSALLAAWRSPIREPIGELSADADPTAPEP